MAVVKIVNVKTTPLKTLKYVSNPTKTNSGQLIDSFNCFKDYKKADMKMEFIRKKYQKDEKTKLLHVVHRFSNKEKELTAEKAHEISKEWYTEMFSDRAVTLVATHNKSNFEKSLHTHFCINAIDLDGNRIRLDKEWIRRAKEKSNEICKKYGLENSIIEFKGINPSKSWYEWDCTNKGISWKTKIRDDIDNLIDSVDTVDELFERLKQQGYQLKRGKYVSFKHPEQVRFVRDKTLGFYYTIEQLQKRIDRSKEIEFIKFKDKKSGWIDSDIYKYKHAKGSIGNIFEIAIKIIEAKLNMEVKDRYKKVYINNFKTTQSLEKLENALALVDKYKVESPEDAVKIINKCEDDLVKLDSWKSKAERRLLEIKEIESQLEEVSKINKAMEKAELTIKSRIRTKDDMQSILDELDDIRRENEKKREMENQKREKDKREKENRNDREKER